MSLHTNVNKTSSQMSNAPETIVEMQPLAPFVSGSPQDDRPRLSAWGNEGFAFDLAVVGLGYVGLPTTLAFRERGHRVLGVDASEARLTSITEQRVDLVDEDRNRLARALHDSSFELTTDPTQLRLAAAVIVCVPTPVDEYQVPDLTILRSACASVVENAVPGQLFILTSTTYVGSTWDLLGAPLANRDLTAGKDIFVAFSPERINPGTDLYAHEDVPRVVGGVTPACGTAAANLLSTSVKNVHSVPDAETAEMTKLVENTFRAVNIALANEFADICHALKLNVKVVIEAAATKPYGFMPFIPGPGVGGHCIPCDPHYLLWQMKKERLHSPVIEQAMNAIAGRPRRIVESAIHALSERDMHINAAKVLLVGVAYKPDVADLRQSPALEILASLIAEGANVFYHDPRFETLTLPGGHVLRGVKDPSSVGADLTIMHTAHSDIGLDWLADEHMVLDTTYRLTDLPQLVRP